MKPIWKQFKQLIEAQGGSWTTSDYGTSYGAILPGGIHIGVDVDRDIMTIVAIDADGYEVGLLEITAGASESPDKGLVPWMHRRCLPVSIKGLPVVGDAVPAPRHVRS